MIYLDELRGGGIYPSRLFSRLAIEGMAAGLGGGTTSEPRKLCTKARAIELGCKVDETQRPYRANQIVPLEVLSKAGGGGEITECSLYGRYTLSNISFSQKSLYVTLVASVPVASNITFNWVVKYKNNFVLETNNGALLKGRSEALLISNKILNNSEAVNIIVEISNISPIKDETYSYSYIGSGVGS